MIFWGARTLCVINTDTIQPKISSIMSGTLYMYWWALWDGSRGQQHTCTCYEFWHKNMFHTSWHLKVELIRELCIWWNRNKTNAGNIHVQYSTVHVVYPVLFLYKPRQPSIHVHTYIIIILFTWSGSGLWWFWTSRLLTIITSTGQWTMYNESDVHV